MNKNLSIPCLLIALILSLFFIRSVYVMSDYHVQQCHWKGSTSKVMGDGFSFDNDVRLKDGLILIKNKPAAKIIVRKYRPYADNIIIISDIEYSALEMYYEKGCY
ncbi:hypothetical protein [Psychrobacter sp. 1044]|uniref:hypothetical protein n=1 Tax=Psychrobacter sp. 1044 TaxID=2772562 RepID=UPI0019180423|nr:hypothetical protein [Psychrobacter sp. 1044]